MGRFADPYGDDRLPEGMICIGYDADTGCKSYVDTKEGGIYTGAPYAEYGVLTPVKGRTTVREDNSRYGRRVYDELAEPVHKRRPARASTTPMPYTISTFDCERIIPRRSQMKEKEVEPKYQDGSDGIGATSQVVNRSKTRRANTTVGMEPPADQDLSEDEEEADAPDSGTSDHEEEPKQAVTPQLGEYIFDPDTLTFLPSEGATSDNLADSIRIPLVANLPTSPRHTVGGVSELAAEPPTTTDSADKKKKRTLLRRLLHVNRFLTGA